MLAMRELLRMPRPDLLLGSTTPLSAPATVALAARLRRIPWVMEVRDLWPAFPIQMGGLPSRSGQHALTRLERMLYTSADYIVTLSPDMTAHIVEGGIPAEHVMTSYNGTDLHEAQSVTDADVHALRHAHNLPDGPIVLYAGTFGRANNIPLLIRIAETLQREHPSASLVCLGDGYGRSYLDAAAARIPVLRVIGSRPRTEIFTWFRLADLSVVAFNDLPVLGTNSPAKLYDSLASETPVLVVNDGWMRSLVETEGCGFFSSAAVPNAVGAKVVELLNTPGALQEASEQARRFVGQHPEIFDRHRIAEQYEALFERIVSNRSAHKAPGPGLHALSGASA